MADVPDADLRHALVNRLRYYNELGIYDFYRRERPVDESKANAASLLETAESASPAFQPELEEEMTAGKPAVVATVAEENIFDILTPKPEYGVADPKAALKLIREDLGDCTRCKL